MNSQRLGEKLRMEMFCWSGGHTSQAAVTDKHGGMIQLCVMGKTRRNSEKGLHLCHYVQSPNLMLS